MLFLGDVDPCRLKKLAATIRNGQPPLAAGVQQGGETQCSVGRPRVFNWGNGLQKCLFPGFLTQKKMSNGWTGLNLESF